MTVISVVKYCSIELRLLMWLVARSNELNDAVAVSDRSLKRLASNIESELHSYYGSVNSLYKRKYHALVASLKDSKSMVLAFLSLIVLLYHPHSRLNDVNTTDASSCLCKLWVGLLLSSSVEVDYHNSVVCIQFVPHYYSTSLVSPLSTHLAV